MLKPSSVLTPTEEAHQLLLPLQTKVSPLSGEHKPLAQTLLMLKELNLHHSKEELLMFKPGPEALH